MMLSISFWVMPRFELRFKLTVSLDSPSLYLPADWFCCWLLNLIVDEALLLRLVTESTAAL